MNVDLDCSLHCMYWPIAHTINVYVEFVLSELKGNRQCLISFHSHGDDMIVTPFAQVSIRRTCENDDNFQMPLQCGLNNGLNPV